MATKHTRDNDPFIVELILSEVCWEEYGDKRRHFTYRALVQLIQVIKLVRWPKRLTYPEVVTESLKYINATRGEYEVLRALTSSYFKRVKADGGAFTGVDDTTWKITIDDQTREIILCHSPTMTRSESLYTNRSFELGSITTEGRPCRHKKLRELHEEMGRTVVYEVLSGRR